jgi:hypothetical protein
MYSQREGRAGAHAADAMRPAGVIDNGELAFAQNAGENPS